MPTMFIHDVTRVRTALDSSNLDDYGQPTPGASTSATFNGLIQPQVAREEEDSRSAGAEVADHVIFLPVIDLAPSDFLESGGERYEIRGIRRFEFGGLAHLEVDARRITGATVGGGAEVVGS